MKQIITFLGMVLIPCALLSQDSIPAPGTFDEGYLFVGPDDVLKFKSYVQGDGYFPGKTSPGVSAFLIRRARLAATGYFQRKFRYMLYASFDTGKAALQEAFLESRHISLAKIRVGQFKVPFSLTNLQSDAYLDFTGRSFIVENFSPSYDIGAMLFGETKRKHFNYGVGVFNGRELNKSENNNSKFIIARIELAPLISSGSPLKTLSLGASVAHGRQNNDMGQAEYKTITGIPVFAFSDSVNQNGKTTIYGYDVAWYIKSFSVQAEYLSYKGRNFTNSTSALDFAADGYHIAATYLLTGEDKKRNEVIKPKHEFNPEKGAWGAFELAGRYEQATLSQSALSSHIAKGTDKLSAVTVGINWYLNDDVKVMLNYVSYQFNKPVSIDNKAYAHSNNLIVRVQYQF